MKRGFYLVCFVETITVFFLFSFFFKKKMIIWYIKINCGWQPYILKREIEGKDQMESNYPQLVFTMTFYNARSRHEDTRCLQQLSRATRLPEISSSSCRGELCSTYTAPVVKSMNGLKKKRKKETLPQHPSRNCI